MMVLNSKRNIAEKNYKVTKRGITAMIKSLIFQPFANFSVRTFCHISQW